MRILLSNIKQLLKEKEQNTFDLQNERIVTQIESIENKQGIWALESAPYLQELKERFANQSYAKDLSEKKSNFCGSKALFWFN